MAVSALSFAHLGDDVLEALEVLRRAARARSIFLHDREIGRLAIIGDPLDARRRRLVDSLARRGVEGDDPLWTWPTMESTATVVSLAETYHAIIVRDAGPIPVAEALDVHLDRLRERLPERPVRPLAAAGEAPREAARCSFCGQTAVEGHRLVSGRAAAICDQCVVLCQEVLAGRRTPAQARELSERARDLLDSARGEMDALRFGGAMERLQGAETALSDLLALLGPTR